MLLGDLWSFIWKTTFERKIMSCSDAAVREIANLWEQCWNEHHFEMMKDHIASEAHWISVKGLHWRGRKEILKVHNDLHKNQMLHSTWKNNQITCEILAPGVILAHIHWTIQNKTIDGVFESERNGIFTWTLVKSSRGWFISASQATNLTT